MNRAKTFRYGGLSLEGMKAWPIPSPIANAFLPSSALVVLKQHKGPACRCVVAKGDVVREGSLLGKGEKPGSVHIHAPVPGMVQDILQVKLASGESVEAVRIDLKGSFDKLGKREERYIWKSMSSVDMVQALREKGVVEMSASGLPLADLALARKGVAVLVLNGVESEPYLRTEKTVLRERSREVLEGFEIIRSLVRPQRAVIALEEDDENELAEVPGILGEMESPPEKLILEARYPQDMPRQLASVLQPGRHTLSGEDIFILSPSTVLAVYEALVLAKPLVERYVTIAGGAIKRPSVLKARIGTLIGDLVEECGGFIGVPEKIVLGGPLRGEPVHSLDAPITKLTASVIALTNEETRSRSRNACIRCGRCAEVCPERLLPADIYRFIGKGRMEEARGFGLDLCTSCGACGYICPSRLPLVEAFQTCGKTKEVSK
jgi:electron transport complex protein RnfC